MTPAIKIARKAKIDFTLHEYPHDVGNREYGKEAALSLGVHENRMFKTLLVMLHGKIKEMAVGIVPVSGQLDLKGFAKATRVKKAEMANAVKAERTTGYVVGGISPLGQKKHLQTIMDTSALQFDTIYVSAGKRGLQIELSPKDLIQLCNAETANISH